MKRYWILGITVIALIPLLTGCGKNGAETTVKKWKNIIPIGKKVSEALENVKKEPKFISQILGPAKY